MSRHVILVTATILVEADAGDYPNCKTAQERLETDLANVRLSPLDFLDYEEYRERVNFYVTGEVIE